MKPIKNLVSAIFAAIAVYLAASGLISIAQDLGRFLAKKKD